MDGWTKKDGRKKKKRRKMVVIKAVERKRKEGDWEIFIFSFYPGPIVPRSSEIVSTYPINGDVGGG